MLSFLPLYLVTLGGVLNYDGQFLYDYYTKATAKVDYQDFVWVEFAGGMGALLFCVSVATVLPLCSLLYYITCSCVVGGSDHVELFLLHSSS